MKLVKYAVAVLFMTSLYAQTLSYGEKPFPDEGEFRINPEALAAYNALTNFGTIWPSHYELDRHINGDQSLTTQLATPPCAVCGVQEELDSPAGAPFDEEVGNYSNMTEERRAELVQLIMEEGPERHAKTTLDLPGGTFEVFNDALTLPDGTYVNFTYGEAREVAERWGCRLPNYDQAEAIRRHAEEQNAVYNARTRPWAPDVLPNMRAMMADPEMRERAEEGRSRLINGHFKWYIDDGSNDFRFYGFRAPPNCYGASRSGPYCQNRGSSGGHDTNWIDYSQSVRLICPAN